MLPINSTRSEAEATIEASSPMAPQLYTVREVAKILRVTGQSVRRLVFSGKIDGRRIGIGIRVPHEALVRFLDASPCTSPDPRRDPRGGRAKAR